MGVSGRASTPSTHRHDAQPWAWRRIIGPEFR